jgi:hypothetical protein
MSGKIVSVIYSKYFVNKAVLWRGSNNFDNSMKEFLTVLMGKLTICGAHSIYAFCEDMSLFSCSFCSGVYYKYNMTNGITRTLGSLRLQARATVTARVPHYLRLFRIIWAKNCYHLPVASNYYRTVRRPHVITHPCQNTLIFTRAL